MNLLKGKQMKGNYGSLVELAAEVERINNVKRDFVVKTPALEMVDDDTIQFGEEGKGQESFGVTDYAHGQIASRLDIPKRFYDRMGADFPGLRSEMVNRMFHNAPARQVTEQMREEGDIFARDRRMVRTLDGKIRAFVSDKFRPYDNFYVIGSALPPILEMKKAGNLVVKSCTLTAIKFYLELVFPQLEAEVRVGDVIRAGIVISNSEVGAGRVNIEGLVYRLQCQNGATSRSVFAKNHIGRKIGGNEEDYQKFQDDTIMSDLNTFRLMLRDIIKDTISQAWINKEADKFRAGAERKINEPEAMVQVVGERFNLLDSEAKKVFRNLCEEKDYTQYGLGNAITALAKDIDGDRSYDLQKTGYEVLTLPGRNWKVISDQSDKLVQKNQDKGNTLLGGLLD